MKIGHYIAFEHQFEAPFAEFTKAQAQASFCYFLANKDKQIEELSKLLQLNGLNLSDSSDDIDRINRWIIDEITYSKTDKYTDDDGLLRPHIDPMWSNVLFDMSIFLSEVVIQKTNNVDWALAELPKNEISYQAPVLIGFSKISTKGYYANFHLALLNYARDHLENRYTQEQDRFNYLVEAAILDDVELEKTRFDHDDFAKLIGLD